MLLAARIGARDAEVGVPAGSLRDLLASLEEWLRLTWYAAVAFASGVDELGYASVDDDTLEQWRQVHNLIIPTDLLSTAQVRERIGRNHLEVAYLDGVLVGCSTVRPPDGEAAASTVIVRVLPEYRGRGIGVAFYERELQHARDRGARVIETVVLESNPDGLRFALARGFMEIERYVLPGHSIPFIDLRLAG